MNVFVAVAKLFCVIMSPIATEGIAQENVLAEF